MRICPDCREQVSPRSRRCEHCGADLALSASLAIHKLTGEVEISDDTPVTPEILIPRFGEQLVEMEVVTAKEVEQALAYQKEQAARGNGCLIGQALCDLGFLTREKLDLAITGIMNRLQDELRQSNRKLEERVRERTAELKKACDRLDELDQLKTGFITMISHELRSPLAHITGFLDLLVGGHLGRMSEEQREALEVIGKSADHLGKLIDELLRFSFISSSELELVPEPVNLHEVIPHVRKRCLGKAAELGIELSQEMPTSPLVVRADSEKLIYTMTQLVDNGIKFTPSGGKVVVGCRLMEGKVVCFVRDSGIGIAPERQGEIFEPFHQLDGSLGRQYGGMGLGLSLVQRIIEKHGSRVEVISRPREGACFEFSLPIMDAAEEAVDSRLSSREQ